MKNVVSVVVPVYNVEKYIDRCIKSIINQSYSNIEILLIDDGSTDKSSVICDKYAKKDSRIIVVHKDNEGLGLTRNCGIELAKGEYITFVDSDDYIEENTIFDAINVIRKDNSDVVMYGFNRVSSNNEIKEFVPNPRKNRYEYDEVLNELLPDYISEDPSEHISRNFTNSSCTCLFKTKLFKKSKVRYASERKIISEDTYMMINLFPYIKSVSIINHCYYNYCENLSSLSHSYRKDRFKALKIFYNCCVEVFDKNKYNEKVYERFNYLFLNYVFANLKTILNNNEIGFASKYCEVNEIIKDDLYRKIINNLDMKSEPIKRRIFYKLVILKQVLFCMLIIRIKYK